MTENNWLTLKKQLVDCAMGRTPADILITNGKWVCVQSGEIIPNTDVAIINGKIAYVGDNAKHTVGSNTEIIDANNNYLVPGLLDGHMHVESGMVTVSEFVRAVMPHGTTGIFIDPHEIANVFGIKGVKLMVDEAKNMPIHVWTQMPSCVPSAPGLETPGASIGPKEVAEAMTWDGIIGLGEMMNFPGVTNSDEKMLAEIGETHLANKVVGGHYASLDLGIPFHGYVAGGAEDDHEGTRKEDAIARIRQGMKAMLRLGSAWHDVESQIPAILEDNLDSRNFILCTDDSHAETIVNDGHMDRVVRHAIKLGLPPMTAIQMSTINTAAHFGLTKDIGMIAPGRFADILIVSDLSNLVIEKVFSKGILTSINKNLQVDIPPYPYPSWALNSVNIGKVYAEADFKIQSNLNEIKKINVIGVIENDAQTKHLQFDIESIDGSISIDMDRDLLKIALVERHKGTGKTKMGFVHGFGFTKSCAVATTVAHDSHQMIVVGTSESDMAIAVNELAKVNGGQIVVKDGEIIGLVDLPIAGLMSNEKAKVVAQKAKTVLDGFIKCGCKLNNPNMQLSLLALVVIPELRISDLGLVDVTNFKFISLIE